MSASQSTIGERTYLKLYYDVLEEVQPLLPPAEFSVFIAIYREIVGYEKYGRMQAALSYDKLQAKTGLARATLAKALKGLIKKQFISVCEKVGRCGLKIYTLAKRFLTGEEDASSSETVLVQRQLLRSSSEAELVVVQKVNRQQFRNQTTSSSETELPTTPQTAPEAARDDPKETLKESSKDTFKESELLKEEEVQEEEYEPQAPEWQSVLEKIKPQVSSGAFGSWFRGSKAFKRNDQFIVQVESSFHKRHMQLYAKLIRSMLEPMLPASMDIFIATADELAPAKVSA